MNKVYKHIPMSADKYLGRGDQQGKVYAARFGPDRYIGRVDLRDGKVYASQFGPDETVGRVEIESGEVYLSKPGPDPYVGKVQRDGRLYRHKSLAEDEYLGKVDDMVSVAHGAGAFLLLVLPESEQVNEETGASE